MMEVIFMTRKEMIETIAKQAGCSKRPVRKKLFQLSARLKRRYKEVLFNQAFLSETTNRLDWEEEYKKWKNDKSSVSPRRLTNTFEVASFPTGVNVLFRVDECCDGYIDHGLGSCGCRLYSYKEVRE